MKFKILLCAASLIISVFFVSCGDSTVNIDTKKFIEKMQQDNKMTPEKKDAIKKSIFPNLKDK